MKSRSRRLALAVMVAVGGVISASALERISDGPPLRREVIRSVRELFVAENFAELDRMAEQLQREKSRLPEGIWKLGLFYAALSRENALGEKIDWPAWLARFERWEKIYPASITARVTHARAMVGYAWAARGGGYADTVSGDGWRLFGERLKIARTMLGSDPALKTSLGYYYAMMPLAMGQEWSKQEEKNLFDEAVALAPDFDPVYFARATFLQPKWAGTSEDEWQRFAVAAAEATKRDHGMTFYARVVWGVLGAGMTRVTAIKAAGIDWPRMRQGFEDMGRQFPDSWWNKNAFCFYAFALGDRETARRLFGELGGRYAPEIWGSAENFQRAERGVAADPRIP